MDLVDTILKEGIRSVSEEQYLEFIEEVEGHLEGENLVEKEWSEFLVVGDTHGDLESAKRPAERSVAESTPIIYLGDYVDRGNDQLENLAFVLSLKMQRPRKVVLLRGNHETERMNRSYGFERVVKTRFSAGLFHRIVSLYEKLPVAAVVNEEYYTAHGGISSAVDDYEDIKRLENREEGYKEIFWNDPSEEVDRYAPNLRRGGYQLYGEKAVKEFLDQNDLSMVIRAHEFHPEGYRYYFDKKLLSIFSISNYRGGNQGKFAEVNGRKIKLIDN